MTSPQSPPTNRLRAPRFAQDKPRRVDYAPNFSDHNLIAEGSQEESDLFEVIERLGRGDLLPERFYRRGIDRDQDELLDDYGIKHLHLGGGGSDVLLFIVEYDDAVLLLEVQDHRHFAGSPPGSVLRSLHASAMSVGDKANAERRVERLEAKARAVRAGLRPRRPK